MTKFEEEFDNNVEIFDVIGTHNSMCCEVDQIKEVFKDWQPQQALPVVPEYVADAISWDEQIDNSIAETLKNVFTFGDKGLKEAGLWIKNNPEKYIIARHIGYTVEKPQLFYLKNKITNSYLCQYPSDKSFYHLSVDDDRASKLATKFTQAEIDSMQAGSYELVPVEDGE